MLFSQAFELMKKGEKVKLPSWGGYWYWDNEKQTIMMHCKDGKVLDIRETEVVDYTFSNVCSDEWIVAAQENTPVLGGIATFNFGEALKYLKRGLKVARSGWNGKGMHVYLTQLYTPYDEKINNDCLLLFNVDRNYNTWVPSITNIMAMDWTITD